MRELFYYQDSMMQQFEAEIVQTGHDTNGSYVVLNNTAFYPTGGGQPHDTGFLNETAVTNVEKVDDEIRHYVADPSTLHSTVHGRLNWARRFDHMQQHTGQHILTAAFVELFNIPTISFHLGTETVTIDLQTSAVTDEQLAAAEARANEIILANLAIETKWVTKDELVHYPVRKEVAVDGDIRLVIIPHFDYNGCGGTHPYTTGAVQAIKILDTEKMKGNVRLHFVCGQRVLTQLAMRKSVLSNVARTLNVPEADAAEAVKKLVDQAKASDKALIAAQDTLLQFEAAELAKTSTVYQAFENRSMQQLQKLAKMITATNHEAVVYFVTENEDKLQFVAVKGDAVSTSMKEVAARTLPLINGKGGGNDVMAQGGGDKLMPAAQLLQHMINK